MRIRHLIPVWSLFAAAGGHSAIPQVESGLMPPRIVLSAAHGAVSRAGSELRFEFENAPLAEVIAAACRVFLVCVACPDGGALRLTAQFSARTSAEALTWVADHAGLQLRQVGSAWSLGQPGVAPLPEACARDFCAGAKGSP
jgi:hypothetical protein